MSYTPLWSLPYICHSSSGSGCVSAFLAFILGASSAAYLCTDINPKAAIATLQTGKQNNATLSPVLTSLHYPLLPRLRNNVDILLFNPPYYPTEEEEESEGQLGANITASWAGGLEGMNTTRLLLEAVPVRYSHLHSLCIS